MNSSTWRTLLSALAVVLALTAVALGYELIDHSTRYREAPGSLARALPPLRMLALAVAGIASALAWYARRRTGEINIVALGLPLRGCAYALLLAFLAGSAAYDPVEGQTFWVRSAYLSTLLLALALWTLALVCWPEALSRRFTGAAGALDLVLMNALVVLAASEVLVTVKAHFFPSAVLWDESSVVSRLAAYRGEPGKPYIGFPRNSRGYYDDEFFPAEGNDVVVALLADSFGLGVVPHEYNFATVAERHLAEALPDRRVALHNFGVPSIGMPEYAWLLENEVPEVSPSLVVLSVFVGNDILGFRTRKMRYYCLQHLRVYDLVRRLLALSGEEQRASLAESPEHSTPRSPPVLGAPPAFVQSAALERPSYSVEAFMRIELGRLEIANPHSPKTEARYSEFLDALDYFHRRLGDKLVVFLIPDEFQVNDGLYEELLLKVKSPDDYRREYPQERIRKHCRERGIPLLDPLDALREGELEERVYHLRDTHWNAHGNRIAGELLGEFLRVIVQ